MYQALYRKYRPLTFDDVYGQEIAKTILTNSLKNNKIEHAYLFYGPRGTGKTSIAKMFARIVNCTDRKEYKACNVCAGCIDSLDKECVDIVEIDAASNNGVDEIRELKSKISLVPTSLKYKVYIVDEVHMLSTGAFNALLKTLEEPPEHAIFILATTEFYKVPSTIVSRCQTIEFKNIDYESMKRRICDISELENIEIEDDAVDEIVINSDGGLRDAIGLLDKMRIYCNNKITTDDVKKVIGTISKEETTMFVNMLENRNLESLFERIDKYSKSGNDLIRVLDNIILEIRNRMIIQKKYDNSKIINKLVEYQEKMKLSNNKKILFEIAIIDTAKETNVRENISREIFSNSIITNELKSEIAVDKEVDVSINNAFCTADKTLLNEVRIKWKKISEYAFDLNHGSIICLLIETVPVVCGDKDLIISTKYEAEAEKINLMKSKVQQALLDLLDINYSVAAISNEEWNKQKKQYLINKKSGKKYEYINTSYNKEVEKKTSEKKEDKNLVDKVSALFGNVL